MAGWLALMMLAIGCTKSSTVSAPFELSSREDASPLVIQSYEGGLSAIQAINPNVKLSLGRDPALPDGLVLLSRFVVVD
jgi:hypothetical protein